jgi:hypothetical protein
MGLPLFRRLRRRWRDERKIRAWRREGGGPPVPHAWKRAVVLEHGAPLGRGLLVETGTWHGDMVEAMRRPFRRVVSIELDAALADAARRRFRGVGNVEILQGDSATVLPRVLADLKEPAVFWLDGHFSGGDTARAATDTPIRQELEQVLSHPVARHVLLIDDADLFTGAGDYPSVEEVRETAERLRPGSTVEVADGIIRVLPSGFRV